MAVDADVEEVRVALALNGGVSLAVWMGGCAVELDRARRTSADGDDRSTYAALCRAFRRELVIDVMTGSSAGGINGALLAAAMTTGGSLEPDFVRERWLDLGDFSTLLQPLSNGRPESLMRGDWFAQQLGSTFAEVMGDRPVTGLCPVLDITTTDLAGTPLQFRDDWGGVLRAREHRMRVQFREPDDYRPERLAAAARASASFPLAFEPWDASSTDTAGPPAARWVIDGGLLDNAPIRAALGLIPNRPAARQVKRFLCYLNGDPEGGAQGSEDGPRPDPSRVLGAVLNLPRTAPFADHLLALQALSRRSQFTLDAELSLLGIDLAALEAAAGALLGTYRRRRRLRALQDLLTEPGDARQAFEHLEAAGLELPWIPRALTVPAEGEWQWGFQTAQRVQHLALDLIRVALPEAIPDDRRRLLRARAAIDARSLEIESGRKGFQAEVADALEDIARGRRVEAAVEEIDRVVAANAGALRAAVVDSATDLLAVADVLGTLPRRRGAERPLRRSGGGRGRGPDPALPAARARARGGQAVVLRLGADRRRAGDRLRPADARGAGPSLHRHAADPAAHADRRQQAVRHAVRALQRLLPALVACQRLPLGPARRRDPHQRDDRERRPHPGTGEHRRRSAVDPARR